MATVVLSCLWFIDVTGWCVHSKIFSFHGHCGRKVSLVHWHNRMMCSFLGNFHCMASVVLRCLWCIDITEWCAHSKVYHFMATVVLSCLWRIDIMEWCVRSFLATVVFRSFWYICNVHSKMECSVLGLFILWPLWSWCVWCFGLEEWWVYSQQVYSHCLGRCPAPYCMISPLGCLIWGVCVG